MELTPENRYTIDSMDYEDLLYRWRFHPLGNAWLQGDTGEYWGRRMRELRALPGGDEEHIRASKSIGWDKR